MSEGKRRHGCLAVYLWMMIVVNSIVAIFYLFRSQAIREISPSIPVWVLHVLTIGLILNVVCVIALFKWKKWGFFGLTAIAAVAFVVKLMIGKNVFQALLGLVGLVILYGVLQIGDKEDESHSLTESSTTDTLSGKRTTPKGWTQLE